MNEDRCTDQGHRSYSADRVWDTCQELSRALTSGQVKDRLGMAAAIGSAVDDAAKATLAEEPVNVVALLAFYAEEYGSGEPKDADYEKAAALYRLWCDEVADRWLAHGIYGTEVILHFHVRGVPYHAHIDVITNDGQVRDLKTSDKRLPENAALESPQLTTYAYAFLQEFGELPSAVALDGLIYANPPKDVTIANPSATKPWYDRQESTRTLSQLASWESEVGRRQLAIRTAQATGVYQTQGRFSAYACKGCVAKASCPSWAGW